MRFLEILLFAIVLISLIARLFPVLRKRDYLKCFPYAAGLLIPIQLIIEGYRWQMVPIYAFTLGLVIVSLVARRTTDGRLIKNKIVRIICIVLCFLLYIGSFIFPALLPIVHLPEPSGPYAVGTASFRMIDENREEVFTEDPGDLRNLLVTAWYPADVEKGMPVSTYWDREGVTGREYSLDTGMGPFWYSHLNLVKTNSHSNAPVSSGQEAYPVIIYSPSFYGMNTENTMLCEMLASYGYIVFGIAHSYENVLSIYPDGEGVHGYLDRVYELYDAHADQEDQLYKTFEQAVTREKKAAILKKILAVDDQFNFLITTRTEDALFVLDEIEAMNCEEGLFQKKINIDRAGVIGWSFGGATAEETCLADSRFRAGVNIDGWPYGELFASEATIEQPFMTLRGEPVDEMDEIVNDLIYEKMDTAGYCLMIEGAEHMNFWDFPFFFDVYKYIGYWGPIDAKRMLSIHDTFIVGFFDKYLKGKDVDLREVLSGYPEVTMRAKGID